jgi:hypothetical protein
VAHHDREVNTMGFFKDMQNTMSTANQMAANAQVMQQQAMAAQSGANVNPADPIWAPIEGITLERYAQLTAQMVRLNLPGADAVTAWVESQGVAPGTWPTVQQGWVARMGQSMDVRTRYGMLYAQY